MSKGLAYENNQHDDWLTPPALLEVLGEFDLDPCACKTQPWRTAKVQFCLPEHNGLLAPWEGRVWCNPPYGKETGDWISRMALHGNGVMLVFARTDTKAFQNLWKWADAILFLYGRLHFFTPEGKEAASATAPSALAAFGENNIESLKRVRSVFPGALVTAWDR